MPAAMPELADTERTTSAPGRTATQVASEELLIALMKVGRAVKHMHTLEIEPAQSFIIHVLYKRGSMRLSDLAAAVRLDVSTVSRHVRGLEHLGYVTRAQDRDDRRATLLSASPDGYAVLNRQFLASRERIAHILRDWSDDDITTLQTVLTRLSRDIEQAQTEEANTESPNR